MIKYNKMKNILVVGIMMVLLPKCMHNLNTQEILCL